jgi:hypothetical protein
MKKTVGWWRVLTFALAFFSFAGDVRSDIAAGFEAARNCTVTGDVLDSETEVSLEVKAASMRDGARCVYNATASGGAYARKVKLFPGENVVTATTATGTDTKYYSFDAGSWSLRVELSWAGNNQDYDLHVNDVYFGNRNSGGGTLDHDWTHNSSDGNPIENITYSQASAGMYRIYVYYYNDNEYNDEGEQVGSPQATTVRVYVNEQRIHSDSYLITEYNGISTGNGKSIWNVATVVLHAGDGAGGYAVDGRRLDLAEQAGLRGISPRTTFSVTDFAGPNGADPVYLLVGDAARFTASGTLNSGSGNEQTGLEILEKYTSAAGTVGTVDGLGVFVGKAPGQTQISCMGHSGSPVDVYVLKVELAPAETNVCWRTQTEVRRLTSDSYWADGSVDWTVEPSTGLDVTSSDDTSFTFSPTNSTPGAYTVTAASSLLPECKDECVVRIVKVDIDPAETNVCWRTQSATLSLTADSRPGGSVDWTVEPSTGLDVTSSDDTSFTFSPTNSTPGAYTVTAASSLLPECKDECVVRIVKVDIDPAETNVCWRAQSAALHLTADSYPGGSVDWTVEPSSGLDVTSSGDTSFTFSPTNSTPGTYTVTAASALLPECKDTCAVRVIKVDSETVATIPADRARNTIGVAEEVNLVVTPSVGSITWSVVGGGTVIPTSGSTTTFTAPNDASYCEVSCNIGAISITKGFTVLEPSGVISAVINSTTHFPVGTAGARMHLYPVVVGPTNVSFYQVQCVEIGRDAINRVGYWATNAAPSHIGNGADVWFPLDQANRWPSTWDHAGIWDVSPPWYNGGSFEWPIPSEWRIGQAGTTKSMVGWDQKFELEFDGKITVRKWGNWVTRTTNDVITTN